LNLTHDAHDIDDLLAKRGGPLETADPAVYDLDGDNLVNQGDVDYLVGTILDTAPGDTNLDGTVDLDDFGALKAGFGQGGGWAAGDFDGSGAVDLSDFGQLKANFGFTRPAGAEPVPEPAAWVLACGALGSWLGARRGLRARRALRKRGSAPSCVAQA
jgi:hypothetical protein